MVAEKFSSIAVCIQYPSLPVPNAAIDCTEEDSIFQQLSEFVRSSQRVCISYENFVELSVVSTETPFSVFVCCENRSYCPFQLSGRDHAFFEHLVRF